MLWRRKARPNTRATGRANPVLGKESKGGWVGCRRRPQPPQPRHLEQCGHATRTPFCFEAPFESTETRGLNTKGRLKTDAKILISVCENDAIFAKSSAAAAAAFLKTNHLH